ncbi:MAG: RecQ family ATP-dependent DNA helicase [Cytophagales bacterium]|nr:RecQ family ATP-dependent DNA helicase [Cytophagales bacterium]
MPSPTSILKQYWGFDTFRDLQLEIIESVLEGKDTLALLPTGGGKSVCFQVPALCMDGLCIVVTPLIALMKDQVSQLKKRGISAKAIFSGMTSREIDITLDNCIYGDTKFLYVSPERLKTKIFQERLLKMNVCLLAIDEAHCISQWGYDFRPAYLEIVEIKKYIADASLIALTATATKEVKEDIVGKLEMSDAAIFQKSFARPNLSYSVFRLEAKEQKLVEILDKVGGTSIVYARTRKRTQEIASFLKSHGISAAFYHAGLQSKERMDRQDRWINNQVRVIVSTNAFGMGIDKPDVRTVIHMDVPDSLEAYYQEAGRAGRDERIAFGVVLFHKKDTRDLMDRAEQHGVTPELIRRTYQGLANYYKLAVGSHGMESLPFQIAEFAKAYDLKPLEVLKALKHLKEIGIVQLSEGIFEQAKLHILISNNELYTYEVANVKFDLLLKNILRLYGGELYQNYIPIKEQDIAQLMKQPLDLVKEQLVYLASQGVLDYRPFSDQPTITFLVPRMVTADLPIDVTFIKSRKDNAIKKAKAMIDYLESATRCRTRILQAYFDEITDENCGACDFCLNQKRNRVDLPMTEVLKKIKSGQDSIAKLKMQLKNHRSEQILQAVRVLIEDGKVKMEKDRFYPI